MHRNQPKYLTNMKNPFRQKSLPYSLREDNKKKKNTRKWNLLNIALQRDNVNCNPHQIRIEHSLLTHSFQMNHDQTPHSVDFIVDISIKHNVLKYPLQYAAKRSILRFPFTKGEDLGKCKTNYTILFFGPLIYIVNNNKKNLHIRLK